MALTLKDIRALDANDPFKGTRDLFALPEGITYLDGNSLGPLPKAVIPRLKQVVEKEWGETLINAWYTKGWVELPKTTGDKLAGLIGAAPGEVVVTESTSINLFRAIHNALQLKGGSGTILTEKGNFPTDLYVLDAIERDSKGKVKVKRVKKDALMEELERGVDILTLTHANFKTSERHDMAALSRKAQQVGALTVWDLSHSAGALPVDLNGCGADFALGCGYKFLNGGPGGCGYIFVARRHQNKILPTLAGWMGHVRPFDFSPEYRPEDGIGRQLTGTPFVISIATLDAALDAFEGVDLNALYKKGEKLGEVFIELIEEQCPEVEIACPKDSRLRTSQVTFRHPGAEKLMAGLTEKRVIGDFRPPDVMRFGMTPLFTRFEDLWRAAQALKGLVKGV